MRTRERPFEGPKNNVPMKLKRPDNKDVLNKTLSMTIKKVKIQKSLLPIIHKCAICDEVFQDKTKLVQHFTSHASRQKPPHSQNPQIQCDWCTQQFPNVRSAFHHKSTAHRTEAHTFDCAHCGKSFGFSFQLEKHNETEHANSHFSQVDQVCDRCSSIFSSEAALATHMKKHDMQISFFVPQASRKLKLNANSEVTPVYYCPHCAMEYILKFNLRKHILAYHEDKIHVKDPASSDIICCNQCNAVFLNKNAFDMHNNHTVNDLFMPQSGLPNLKVDLD